MAFKKKFCNVICTWKKIESIFIIKIFNFLTPIWKKWRSLWERETCSSLLRWKQPVDLSSSPPKEDPFFWNSCHSWSVLILYIKSWSAILFSFTVLEILLYLPRRYRKPRNLTMKTKRDFDRDRRFNKPVSAKPTLPQLRFVTKPVSPKPLFQFRAILTSLMLKY